LLGFSVLTAGFTMKLQSVAWIFPPIAVSTAAIAAIRGHCEVAVSAGFMKVRWFRRNRKFVIILYSVAVVIIVLVLVIVKFKNSESQKFINEDEWRWRRAGMRM
jgi:hypothetical protein